jgi:hypothetical protein
MPNKTEALIKSLRDDFAAYEKRFAALKPTLETIGETVAVATQVDAAASELAKQADALRGEVDDFLKDVCAA